MMSQFARRFMVSLVSVLFLVLISASGGLYGEDLIELQDGRTISGEIVEQNDDQIMIRVAIGGGAVLGFRRRLIVRMVIDGEEHVLQEPAESKSTQEPEPEPEPDPEPVPLPLMGESNFWKNLKGGEQQHVIIYGTSLVTDRHSGLPRSLQSTLEQEFGKNMVRVTERANAGEYSKWGADNVDRQVIRDRPNAVIIEFASNDAVDRFNQSVDQARQNWVRMIRSIQEKSPDTEIFLYVTAPPWDKDSSGRGAHALRRQGIEEYFNMVRIVSIELQTYIIDTYWEFLDVKDPPGHREYRKFIGDGHHPSGRGRSQIILPLMLQAFAHGSSDTVGKPGINRWPHVQNETQR